MLVQSKQLAGARILSLHISQPIGQLGDPIINPHKFRIEGFYCLGRLAERHKEPVVLLAQDIRQVSAAGAFVNSADELTPLSELVRLQQIIKIKFSVIGKPVRTEAKQRVGKVDEYVINSEDFKIQKIYVRQPILKNLSLHSLVIDRSQIIEINDKQIVVSDATIAKPAVATTPVQPA